jgi:CubicO group peptidase (beta-lactamase class C family)
MILGKMREWVCTGRPVIGWQFWLPGILLLVLGTSTGEEERSSEVLVGDVWWGPVPGKSMYEQMAIEFTLSEMAMQGVIHFLSGGKKVSELPLTDIRFDSPKLSFQAGVFAVEGIVDHESGELKGTAAISGSRSLDFDAQRRDPASIPGLLAGDMHYQYRLPPGKADGWRVAAAEDVGLEKSKIERIVRDIASGQAGVIHSLVIVQNGCLVLDEYFHGYGPDDLHAVTSCSKSITSLLVGLVLDQGLISSVDVPVLDFFPAYAKDAATGWSFVKIVHVLTMTAGLGWPQNEGMPERGANPGFSGNGPEGFRRLFAREIMHEPGTKWNYTSPDVNVLGGIIHQATGMHADVFAGKYLFTPLGITNFDWSTFGKIEGYPNLGGSLRLRPRDMAKIGALVLTDGRWQDKHLISPEWIRASCSAQADTGDEKDEYGYLWWVMSLPGGRQVIAARGWGTQFILIDPEYLRVIVTTGGNDTNGKTFAILRVLARHLYPEALEGQG